MLEQWTLSVPEDERDWFVDWVLREPSQVSRHLTAGMYAYLAVSMFYGPGEIRTVREYFGGMGVQSLVIQQLFRPQDHIVRDYSSGAVEYLRELLSGRGGVQVHQADAYDLNSTDHRADLVGLDFGNFTAHRLRPGQKQRSLLDAVMLAEPKAVVLTDIAGPRLHLHRARYGEVLGLPGYAPLRDYPHYLDALSDWLRAHYGYVVAQGFYHRWSAVLALVPGHRLARPGYIRPVPEHPVGLEVKR